MIFKMILILLTPDYNTEIKQKYILISIKYLNVKNLIQKYLHQFFRLENHLRSESLFSRLS